MSEYLIELYVPRADVTAVARGAELARRAAEEHTRRSGPPVRYVRSIHLVEDETCFLIFEADSADAVSQMARAGGLPCERVGGAVETWATAPGAG